MNDDHFYDDISPLTVRDETNSGPKVPPWLLRLVILVTFT